MTKPLIASLLTLAVAVNLVVLNEAKVVKMTNNLKENKTLQVHCRSKDDDLGVHSLGPGEQYHFSFGDNLWGNTLFFCDFGFNNKIYSFNIYLTGRDVFSCNSDEQCLWMINDSGPCMFDCTKADYTHCYPWKGRD